MNVDDKNNLLLALDQTQVDKLNSKFYSRFSYPWYPREFPYYENRDLWRKVLCQEIGNWTLDRIPEKPKIWVAGCGTNQAVFTALKYPDAEVFGMDVSPKSIEVSQKTAAQLKIKNLTLEVNSLNESRFENEFDYIICTGVIHHNANPAITLQALTKGLKKNGVMELMVYNYYHRIFTTAFQKAIHKISRSGREMDLEQEYRHTKQLLQDFPVESNMKNFLTTLKNMEESLIADALIQPVEHSYTIESLNELVESCNLELLSHCVNQFDHNQNRLSWNLNIDNDEYSSLPDIERWQVGNLLMLENSPMLWFYLQNRDSEYQRCTEAQMNKDFLSTTFSKTETIKHRYVLSSSGRYENRSDLQFFPLPKAPIDKNAFNVFNAVDTRTSIGDLLERLGQNRSFKTDTDLRINLTTSSFPYLLANNH